MKDAVVYTKQWLSQW